MAKIIAGMGTSHVPGLGAAMDNGKTHEAYWQPVFKGLEPLRAWHRDHVPDVNIIVYNDHATAIALDNYATFTLGVAEQFLPADEGWGRRQVPVVQGHPELAWHLVESLIMDEFDLAISGDLDVDHGLTVPLSIAYDQPAAWPTPPATASMRSTSTATSTATESSIPAATSCSSPTPRPPTDTPSMPGRSPAAGMCCTWPR